MKIIIPFFVLLFPILAFTGRNSVLQFSGRVPASIKTDLNTVKRVNLKQDSFELELNVAKTKYHIKKVHLNNHKYFEIIFH